MADYDCKIIGDGLTPETAFRPAIADVVDPKTGKPAYTGWSASIQTDAKGVPTLSTCAVKNASGDPALVASNPDVVAVAVAVKP